MMPEGGFGIVSTGAFLPARRVTNEDLALRVDTNPAWIVERTGIRERRQVDGSTCTSDLAAAAARDAIKNAGVPLASISLTVLGTSTPDWIQPSTACAVHDKLGIRSAPAFDVAAVCSGFVYAFVVAESLLKTNSSYKNALVIGADTFSKFLDFQDRTSCVFFGDGAGAAVLGRVPEGYGLLRSKLVAEGHLHDVVKVPAGGSCLITSAETLHQRQHFFRMDGRTVWDFATAQLPQVIKSVLDEAGVDLQGVDLFVFHQANRVLIDHCIKALGVDPKKTHFTVEELGNTAAASIPITLHSAVQDGRLARGDLVVLAAVGGGMTAGAILLRWY